MWISKPHLRDSYLEGLGGAKESTGFTSISGDRALRMDPCSSLVGAGLLLRKGHPLITCTQGPCWDTGAIRGVFQPSQGQEVGLPSVSSALGPGSGNSGSVQQGAE